MTHRRRNGSDEIDEEIRAHLRMAVAERVARGEDPHEAELAARREFGNVSHVAQVTREMRMGPWLTLLQAGQDLRFATRRMSRAPALAVAIALTIGLGLGAASAILAVSGAALVEPLPYHEPERLVHLWELRADADERTPTSYPTLADWRAHVTTFSALEGYDPGNFVAGVGDEARMMRGAQVTPGFFGLLGARLAAGRDFAHEAKVAAETAVVIVSDGLARTALGGEPLGRTIAINGAQHMVIGVLPADFHFALLQNADLFVPLAGDAPGRASRSQRTLHALGRLADDASLASARTELSNVMLRVAADHPEALAGRTIAAMPLRAALLQGVRPMLAALLLAVVLLLVIMAVNLALLMLTRLVEREPELAMRAALGASRARLLRQLVVESLAPALAGAALALAIGHFTTRALIAAIPVGVRIGMPYLADAGLDLRTVGAIVGLTALLTVSFGLLPALSRTRFGGGPVGGAARVTRGRASKRLRRSLVAAQVAISVVLLVASGLLATSFANLVRRDVGFQRPDELVTARIPVTGSRYEEQAAQQRFYEAVLDRARAVSGVRSVAAVDEVPGGGGGITTFEWVDEPRPRAEQPRVALRTVAGAYFPTMGIALLSGRDFDARDNPGSPPAAVVSATFARRLGADGPVLGRRLRLARTDDTEWEVIGVAADVQVASLDAESPPVIYLSHLHAAENRMTLVLRTERSVAAVAAQLRSIVKSLDGSVPVYAVTTMQAQLSESRAVFIRRLPMILCGVFAAAALALTLVALYAVFTHDVATRRRELGIRLALGSSPGVLRRLVLGDALRLSAIGIVAGALVAAFVAHALGALLFGVAAAEWQVYSAVVAVVLASAVLATVGPALRAGAVNPAVTMRAE